MSRIDSIGTYVGEVVESAISTTKNGFPQWTPRLLATKKYIDDAEGMKHFGLTEAGYVDWSSFSEDIVGFFVLYGAKGGGDPEPTLNYEQAQIATGWDGSDFESLNQSVGKMVMFRVQEATYEGKTSLKVAWIDKEDASPTTTLKSLDSAAIKNLNAKFLKTAAKPTAAKPATPAAKPGKPGKPAGTTAGSAGAPSAAASATPTAGASTSAESTTSPAATPTTTSPSKAPKPPKKSPPKQPEDQKTPADLPAETSQADAWEYVTTHKGQNEDTVVEEAWIAACQEVGGDKDEDQFTPADWAKVRNIVLKDLAA